jgi:hypothetical protein
MKWPAKYKDGERRITHVFLFFPKKIDNEWRWLEYACIKQTYYMGWLDDRWATYAEYFKFVADGNW